MRVLNVLFLCTGNSARSVLAESALNHLGRGRFRAFSAGSHPTGQVNPHALRVLAECGYPTEGLRSKSWDEFADPTPLASGAPAMDLIITVCDNAAGEACPVWPGHPATAHWGLPDPAAVEGDAARIEAAFRETLRSIRQRVRLLVELPVERLERLALEHAARSIPGNESPGQEPGAGLATSPTKSKE